MITCIFCGKVTKGRPDKKFCSDNCRNTYHNRIKKKEDPKKQMERYWKNKLIDDMGNDPL
jgi:predicted nucleic acid-binding Zn ribbon protein